MLEGKMFKYSKCLVWALLLAALFVFTSTSSVFAEDGGIVESTQAPVESTGGVVTATEVPLEATPQPEIPTAEPSVEPTMEPVATEVPTAEETVLPTEEPLAEETQVPTEEPLLEETTITTGETTETPVAVEPIIVTDGNGDPLPLTSAETTEVLQSGDPYFMVGTQKYAWVMDPDDAGPNTWESACPAGTAAGSTCFMATPSYAINAALDYINSHGLVPTDKKIYVEADEYFETINIDGTGSIFYRQLTGLIGVNGSEATTLYGGVNVTGTTGGFTLSGFTINGGVIFGNNTGNLTLKDLNVNNTSGEGIYVNDQIGAVTVENVKSNSNFNTGMTIVNDKSTTAYPVTVTNSEFNDNDYYHSSYGLGAEIISKGAVTINGVSASGNTGAGMAVATSGVVTVKNSVFSDNRYLADGYLEGPGTGLAIYNNLTTAAVVLENIQTHDNGGSGIWIITRGPITAKNVVSTFNAYYGLQTNNDFMSDLPFPMSVNISDSSFHDNYSNGLEIYAKGNVTLTFVNASNNYGDGVFVDTCLWNGAACTGTGAVVLLNPYQIPMNFNYNGGDGLHIEAAGTVVMNGILSSANAVNGLYVANNYPGKIGGVTLNMLPVTNTVTPASRFNYNGDFGILFYSNGPITINGTPSVPVNISWNGAGIGIGDAMNPAGSTVSIKGITLNDNLYRGLVIYSKGSINVDSIWVNQNAPWDWFTQYNTFELNNTFGSGGIIVTNSSVNNSGEYGFYIASKGAVSLKNVQSYLTGLAGIYIDNHDALLAQPVTLMDVSVSQAHGSGIEIQSRGTVNISGTNSFNNSGMHLSNNSVTVGGKASDITWFDFTGSAGQTVEISADYDYFGLANLILVNASSNSGVEEALWSNGSGLWSGNWNGAYYSDISTISLPNDGEYYIFLDWFNDYDALLDYALYFVYGSTTPYVTDAPAYKGIYIDNTYSNSVGDVNIIGSAANPNPWVSNNTGDGIQVYSKGNIKLLNASLVRNGSSGAELSNSGAASAKTVTAGSLSIYNSSLWGLNINSIGAVSMSNISSIGNGYSGIEVQNCYLDTVLKKCKGAGAVSLTGTNYLDWNGGYGLIVYTIGLVTLNNIGAYGNQSGGMYIYGPTSTDLAAIPAGGGVTLTYSNNFRNSVGYTNGTGISISTYGPVSLKNLDVYDNGWTGLKIRNNSAAANQPVTLTDVNVWNSGYTGIDIMSKGTVTLNGVQSSGNYYRNVWVNYGETMEGLAAGPLQITFSVPDAVSLEIDFTSAEFEGIIVLYDPSYSWVATDHVNPDDPGYIDAGTITTGGAYTLEIWNYNNIPFKYTLSVSDAIGEVDSNQASEVNGISIYNSDGSGDVILAKTVLSGTTEAVNNTGKGIQIYTNGNVRISDTLVERNYSTGLQISSNGQAKSAALTNITATNNGSYGVQVYIPGAVAWSTGFVAENGWNYPNTAAMISNSSANIPAPVTITNVKVVGSPNTGLMIYSKGSVGLTDVQLIDNQGDGLYVYTYGAITLTRVKSLFNSPDEGGYSSGAILDNTSSLSLTPPGVTIIDSDFNYNTYGLEVFSKGPVTLNGVNVEGNYDHGRYIDLGTALVSELPGYVEMFVDNYGWVGGGDEATWDFTVTSADYDLALYLYLFFNGNWGLYDENDIWVSASYSDIDNVPHFILQPGDYHIHVEIGDDGKSGHYKLGLNADPEGGVSNSSSLGAIIQTDGNVTVARSTYRTSSNFKYNGNDGLYIVTTGSVAVSDVNIWNNIGFGLYIYAQTNAKPVTLTRVYISENEYQNSMITAKGPVSWNTGYSQGAGYGTVINNSGAAILQPVTIINVLFDYTSSSGLEIYSLGNVSLTGVGASYNNGSGIYINNSSGTGMVAINNTNGSTIMHNGAFGLEIHSKGAITLTNVSAIYNEAGILADNSLSTALTPPGIIFNYTAFGRVAHNDGDGIRAMSRGAVTISAAKNLMVTGNLGTGILIDNSFGTAPINVSGLTDNVSQVYIFGNSAGMIVYSEGAVTMRNIASYNNNYEGLIIGDESGARPSAVTLTNIISQLNGYWDELNPADNVRIFTDGAVTILNIDSNQSAGNGLYIEAGGVVNIKKALVTWSGTGESGSNLWGISITTPSNVILDSIIASSNDNNLFVDADGAVTLLGTLFKNEFNNSPYGTAVEIYAGTGGITLNRFAVNNTYGSVFLATTGKVTLNTGYVQNNGYGITIQAGSGAAITNVFSMNNGYWDINNDGTKEIFDADGINIQLTGGTAAFTDSVFIGNTGNGIEIFFNSPSYMVPYPFTMIRTLYFGNDTDTTADRNLYIRHL